MQFISKAKKYSKYHNLFFKPNIKYFNLKKKNKIWFNFTANIILKSLHLKMLINLIKFILKPYKRFLKFKLNIFPDFGKTQKPKDIRMGRGKGEVYMRVVFCKRGMIFLKFKKIKNIPMEFVEYLIYECSMKLQVHNYFLINKKYD